ncbi:Uncharacterized protein tag-51 [Toxocara canis]|uniref:Uncharacterized protein tag-51 n=1 Tax=Toxocara canis TaxID=6265 RepID=A0A0B2VNI7_TOXCA|nr:Uncharacterized protein tag-51 [Toxocara canis]
MPGTLLVNDGESGSARANTVSIYSDDEIVYSVGRRLFRMFEDYCRHAAERRKNSYLSDMAYGDLFTVAIRYGFGYLPHIYVDPALKYFLFRLLQIKGIVMQPLRNISLALNELSEQEASFGFYNWALRFLTPYVNSQSPYVSNPKVLIIRDRGFRKRMFDLREAVLCSDWPKVGCLIGCTDTIRLDPTQFTAVDRQTVYSNVYGKLAPFCVSIFHAGVQRLMQHNIPRDVLAKSIAEFMMVMIKAQKVCDRGNIRVRNFSLFYLCEVLTFLIANGFREDANDLVNAVSSLSPVAQTKSQVLAVRSYSALYRYEMWRMSGSHDEPAGAIKLVDELIYAINLSASDPILLEWVQPRLLNPQSFDMPSEMMRQICKILFEFLDYGESRTDERAWAFLWACVQFVRDTDLLRSYWQLRSSWWPKFHSVPLSKAGDEYRSKVFNLLEQRCGTL